MATAPAGAYFLIHMLLTGACYNELFSSQEPMLQAPCAPAVLPNVDAMLLLYSTSRATNSAAVRLRGSATQSRFISRPVKVVSSQSNNSQCSARFGDNRHSKIHTPTTLAAAVHRVDIVAIISVCAQYQCQSFMSPLRVHYTTATSRPHMLHHAVTSCRHAAAACQQQGQPASCHLKNSCSDPRRHMSCRGCTLSLLSCSFIQLTAEAAVSHEVQELQLHTRSRSHCLSPAAQAAAQHLLQKQEIHAEEPHSHASCRGCTLSLLSCSSSTSASRALVVPTHTADRQCQQACTKGRRGKYSSSANAPRPRSAHAECSR